MLSTPTLHGPPSRISSIRPSRSPRTCCAVVGLGRVEAFAEGAARGRSARWIRRRAKGDEGIRQPNVGRPDVTSGARGECGGFGRRIVKGPGQKRDISGAYIGGMGSTWSLSPFSETSPFRCCGELGLSSRRNWSKELT